MAALGAATAPAEGVGANAPGNELLNGRKTEQEDGKTNADLMETSPGDDRTQGFFAESPKAHGASIVAPSSGLRCTGIGLCEHPVVRIMVRGTRYTEPQPSARCDHPVHLAERGGAVWEELETLLTEDHVTRGCRAGQSHGTSCPPGDRRTRL